MSLVQTENLLLFFSYARQDKGLRDKLEEHLSNLKYRGLITTWHIREIGPVRTGSSRLTYTSRAPTLFSC